MRERDNSVAAPVSQRKKEKKEGKRIRKPQRESYKRKRKRLRLFVREGNRNFVKIK